MYLKFYGFLFLQLFMLISAFNLDDAKKKKLGEIIDSQMKLANLHTLGIVITNKTHTLFQNIFGENKEANSQTPFLIGSVTKSFTALSILQLNISLDQTLDNFHLGEYLDEDLLKDITVAELLNHTSGLDSFNPKRITSRGTYSYSNYGFGLLGKIIEEKSGQKYSKYVKENIFNPLNMTHTIAEYDESIIESYSFFLGLRTKFSSLESEINDDNGFYIPTGHISTSIEDMGNYLRFYLNENNSHYVSNMAACGVEVQDNIYYGMGLFIVNRSDNIIYRHSGETASFSGQLYIYPELNLGYFFVANTADLECPTPFGQFTAAIENFLMYNVYEEVDGSIHSYVHFTHNLMFLFIIAIPITYLIITVVRKIKRKKYTWFIGVKGKIIFGVDVFVLFILPIIILIICYGVNGLYRYACNYVKDLLFTIITFCVALWLNFIIKIVYIILYIKLKWEPIDIKIDNSLQELAIKLDNDNENEK